MQQWLITLKQVLEVGRYPIYRMCMSPILGLRRGLQSHPILQSLPSSITPGRRSPLLGYKYASIMLTLG